MQPRNNNHDVEEEGDDSGEGYYVREDVRNTAEHFFSADTPFSSQLLRFGVSCLPTSNESASYFNDSFGTYTSDLPMVQSTIPGVAGTRTTNSFPEYTSHATHSVFQHSNVTTATAFSAMALATEQQSTCYYDELSMLQNNIDSEVCMKTIADTPINGNVSPAMEFYETVGVEDGGDHVTSQKTFCPTELLPSGLVTQCLICGDRATGKHYGAYSCDGCKGFFRRSVRRNHSYSCRHKRACIITKDKRNQCRFCRLRKCFRAGMKKSAVQNERDKISNRPMFLDTAASGQPLLDLQQLMQAEASAHHAMENNPAILLLNEAQNKKDNHESTETPFADVIDICESMKTQLNFLIEWAKNLPSFSTLAVSDQIALLQAHAGEMLILGAVWRSLSTASIYNTSTEETGSGEHSTETNEAKDSKPSTEECESPKLILLGNRRIISKDSSRPEIAEIARRILAELYLPMQDLCLEDSEVACLRAIVFFDPNCEKLTEPGRQLVRTCQYQIQLEMMQLMNDKLYLPPGRFGALLLLLPELRSITQRMINGLQIAKQMGMNRLDGLLSEILLNRNNQSDKDKPSSHQAPFASTPHQSQCSPRSRSYTSFVTTPTDEVKLISDVTGMCLRHKDTDATVCQHSPTAFLPYGKHGFDAIQCGPYSNSFFHTIHEMHQNRYACEDRPQTQRQMSFDQSSVTEKTKPFEITKENSHRSYEFQLADQSIPSAALYPAGYGDHQFLFPYPPTVDIAKSFLSPFHMNPHTQPSNQLNFPPHFIGGMQLNSAPDETLRGDEQVETYRFYQSHE